MRQSFRSARLGGRLVICVSDDNVYTIECLYPSRACFYESSLLHSSVLLILRVSRVCRSQPLLLAVAAFSLHASAVVPSSHNLSNEAPALPSTMPSTTVAHRAQPPQRKVPHRKRGASDTPMSQPSACKHTNKHTHQLWQAWCPTPTLLPSHLRAPPLPSVRVRVSNQLEHVLAHVVERRSCALSG